VYEINVNPTPLADKIVGFDNVGEDPFAALPEVEFKDIGFAIKTGDGDNDNGKQGLRYSVEIPADFRDYTIEDNGYILKEYGVLASLTENEANLRYIGSTDSNTVASLYDTDLMIAKSISYQPDTDTDVARSISDESVVYAGAIVNIPKSKSEYTTSYTFKPYCVFEDSSATEHALYGEEQSSTIYDVAQLAVEDYPDNQFINDIIFTSIDFEDVKPTNGTKIKIACVGDSITYGTGLSGSALTTGSYPAVLQSLLGSSYQVGNYGKPSAYIYPFESQYNIKTDKALSYKNTVEYTNSLAFAPDVVIFALGTNDVRSLAAHKSEAADALVEAYNDLMNDYLALPSVQKAYVVTVHPMPGESIISEHLYGYLQGIQKEAANNLGLEVIDLYEEAFDYFEIKMHESDKVHPNAAGYSVWANIVYSALTGNPYTVPEIPQADTGVVYVSSSGNASNDGLTPNTPLNNIAIAAGHLKENGGTIVICGSYTMSGHINMPVDSKPITITSLYNGTDYRTSGAKLATKYYLYLNGDYTFENMIIESTAAFCFICNYNNVTFGDGLTCTLNGSTTYPVITVGYNVASACLPASTFDATEDCVVTVNSGSWSYVRGGNRRVNGDCALGEVREGVTVSTILNGGNFYNTGNNQTSGNGMNSVAGDIYLEINGGTYTGSVYGIGRIGTNTTGATPHFTGSITVKLTGGDFKTFALYQDSTSPRVAADRATLILTGDMTKWSGTAGFGAG
jgi:lysophospholipase L1-like esterase